MELNKIYQEPCLETLSRMPNGFLDCVVTSPPYWQLRDYGYDGQWGLEPTYTGYLEHLWEMMDLIFKKLKPGGTVFVNLGDTYSTQLIKNSGLPSKCLMLLPHRFAIGCIDRGWVMRNDLIWAKRNSMPESSTDRFSKKHEYFFLMVKSEKYFFDLDAIRDKNLTNENRPPGIVRNRIYDYDSKMNDPKLNPKAKTRGTQAWTTSALNQPQQDNSGGVGFNEKGKNPGSVSDFWDGNKKQSFEEYMNECTEYYYSQDDFWDINTKPSANKHFASYNDDLIKKPILAGCPEGGIIYDPFMGTGSTAEVCLRTKRNYIGSEMSAEYCKIAEERLMPFKNNLFS